VLTWILGTVFTIAKRIFAMGAAQAQHVSTVVWQQNGGSVFERFWGYISREYRIGHFEISISGLALGIAVLLISIVASRWLRSFLERRLAARTHLDPGLQHTLLRLTHYLIVAIGILWAANIAFNADLTTLAVLFTALSVGIGFGLQFIAGDIAAGFILLFERPVRVGDFITVLEAGGKTTEGRVHSINLRTTVVMTNDRIAVVVPNSKLVNQSLTNWSYRDRRTRISIPIGVSYDSNEELVTKTLLRAAEGVENVLTEPKPSVQFMKFGDSSLDFRLLVWTDRPRRHPKIKSDINYRIKRLFDEAGIEIPYPQREFRLRGGALQVEAKDSALSEDERATH